MRNRWIFNFKHIISLLFCIAMILPFAACKKNDVAISDKNLESNEVNSEYDINEVGYDTYIEYENMFLSAEVAYLNDGGYVESSDVPAILDEVEQLAQQGVSDGTIAYYNREDDNFFIKFSSGIPYLFVPYEKGVLSGGGGGQILTVEPNEDDYSVNFSYVVAMATAWGAGIEYEDSLHPSSNANLVVENVPDLYTYDSGGSRKNSNVTVESLKTLADYKIIIWEGHGGYNEEIHSALITGESFVGWEEFSKYKSDLEDDILILTSFPTIPETDIAYSPIRYYGITSKFIEKYVGEMDESLIFLGACSSLKDDVLAQSFLDKGASVVLGYTQETTMYYEMISRTVFFNELVQEKGSIYQTVADAYQSTMNIVGSDNGCILSYTSQDGIDDRYTLNGIIEEPLIVEIPDETIPEEGVEALVSDDINAINALLIGVDYLPNQAEAVVTSWPDERIFNIICSKRLWDWDSAYLAQLAIGDEFSIDLSSVEELTQDMFGREFPVNSKSDLGSVSGNKLNVKLIIGESTELVVQNGTKQGNRVTVVGSVYHHYVPFSEFCGYFLAELVENSSSIYGYTLTSIYRTEGNQSFDNITASASSELKETNITHYANRAIDGDRDTAWVEGVRGVGINEWIMLETTDDSKMTVSAIEFSLGYQKSEQLLQNNGWPSKVLIECESGYKQEAEFYTCDYSSVVVLDQPQTTGWIKITILEATPGVKYDDTCISEIRLYGIDPNLETTPDDGESLTAEHDSASETGKLAHEVNISEDEAYEIACDYWDYSEGDTSEESGFELYLVYDGLLEKSDGNHYYAYRLRWWVPENNMLSTVDYLYINAETGECSYNI